MGDLRNVSGVCAADYADLGTCGLWGMKPIRPLFRGNGRRGTPQCHGTFQDWIGDPLRGSTSNAIGCKAGNPHVPTWDRGDFGPPCDPRVAPPPINGPRARVREFREVPELW